MFSEERERERERRGLFYNSDSTRRIPHLKKFGKNFDKKFLLVFLIGVFVVLFVGSVSATNYYVNATTGNDSNNGTSPAFPWKTIAHVNAQTFQPGDNIYFERGDTWHEQLNVPSSGNSTNYITFGAYGVGAKPTIDGADNITRDWFPYPGNFLKNPGFESWTSSLPDSWGGKQTGNSTISKDTSDVHSGNLALNMTVDSSNSDVYFGQTVTINGSTNYNLSFWYKVPVGKTFKIRILNSAGSNSSYLNSSGAWQSTGYYTTISGTGSWTNYSVSFPPNVTISSSLNILIERSSAASSSMLFDDFSLSKDLPQNTSLWGYATGPLPDPPKKVWFNGTLGTNKNVVSNLSQNGDWAYDGTFLWVYSSNGESPSLNWPSGIITTARDYCIGNPENYTRIENLHLERSISAAYAAGGNEITHPVIGGVISNVTINDAGSDGMVVGSQHIGESFNYTIVGCNISNNGVNLALDHGIYLSHMSNSTISNNTFVNNAGWGVQIQDLSNYNHVFGNYFLNNWAGGVVIFNNSIGMPYGNLVDYNIIKGSYIGSAGYNGNAFYIGGLSNGSEVNYIYNNVCEGMNNSQDRCFYKGTNSNVTINFDNNLLLREESQNVLFWANSYINLVSDYNILYPNSSQFIWWGASKYNNLSSYQSGSSLDAHSISANPLFLNSSGNMNETTDFQLKWNSPAIDAGTDVNLTTDYFGNPIYGTPDIGAIEYQPPYNISVDSENLSISPDIRIYGDGKFRYLNSTASSGTAKISVVPVGGYPYYNSTQARPASYDLNVTKATASNTSWNIVNLSASGNVTFKVCGLSASSYYKLSVDNGTNGTLSTDSSGCLSYVYKGHWSTHDFSVVYNGAIPVTTNNNGGSSGGGGGSVTPSVTHSYSWDKLNPGNVNLSNFGSSLGVSEIILGVGKLIQNAKLSVINNGNESFSEIPINKTGKVYNYIHIDTTNLDGNLTNVSVTFLVNATWASLNSLTPSEIGVFKYNSSTGEWNDLNATYTGEVNGSYLYKVFMKTLSYFAVGSREAAVSSGNGSTGNNTVNNETSSVTNETAPAHSWISNALNSAVNWVSSTVGIIVILVLIIAIILFLIFGRKKDYSKLVKE